jgi:AcrR family transcriptional regulator
MELYSGLDLDAANESGAAMIQTGRLGLRERKKQRTRQAIIDTAVRLFAEHGYAETTLVEIADVAEISPSTFFNYFSSKVDIVFGLLDAVIESAQERILNRLDSESAKEAVLAWIAEDLVVLELPYAEALRSIPKIIASDSDLRSQERLRLGQLEDVFAAAFARDLNQSPEGLHARVMATITLRGMSDIWSAWYDQHWSDRDFDPAHAIARKADYLERALEAGLGSLISLPSPTS